jgi:hypothetical protein
MSIYVTIVSNNPETLDSLKSYLEQAGVASHCTRSTHDLDLVAPPSATAAVIFPHDFAEASVLSLVRTLRHERPHLLTLLITRVPHRFRSVLYTDARSRTPIVLPRPSFGWDILDALRDHSSNPEV